MGIHNQLFAVMVSLLKIDHVVRLYFISKGVIPQLVEHVMNMVKAL